MRKIIFVIILFSLSSVNIFATNSCIDFKPEKSEFIWVIKSWVNIRNFPCSYKSKIVWWAEIWESYTVLRKVDWWYEILLSNWEKWWIWDAMMKKSWSNLKKKYVLSIKDKLLVNKIVSKIQKIVDRKNLDEKQRIIKSLKKINKKAKKYTKADVLIEHLVEESKKINFNKISAKHYKKYSIDIEKIKREWINWHNSARKWVWSKSYSYDYRLDTTSYERSTEQKDKWIMEHKRDPWDSYYNYNKIENWFQDRWVKCEVKGWATSSESIWKYWYYCTDWECTDEILESLKIIFDIYMAEKWQSYDAHYRAIIHKDLSKIWIWISVKETTDEHYNDFYVTTHYCTKFRN